MTSEFILASALDGTPRTLADLTGRLDAAVRAYPLARHIRVVASAIRKQIFEGDH